jgi:hypothetical protein
VGNLDIEWTSERLTFRKQTSRKAASRVGVIFWAFSRLINIAKEFFFKLSITNEILSNYEEKQNNGCGFNILG